MPTPTMQDPKQVLDKAIDKAFAREPAISEPVIRPFGRIVGTAIATSVLLSVAGTAIAAFVARRRTPRAVTMPRMGLAKYTRRFGFGRYHLGQFGTAFIAYTYKVPQVRFQLPRVSYKLPAVRK